MAKKTYNKLVRDKIPEIILAEGLKPVTRILEKEDYIEALINKLREELAEFSDNFSVEELADMQEVVNCLRDAIGKTSQELEDIRHGKAAKNGGFEEKVFLISVE